MYKLYEPPVLDEKEVQYWGTWGGLPGCSPRRRAPPGGHVYEDRVISCIGHRFRPTAQHVFSSCDYTRPWM